MEFGFNRALKVSLVDWSNPAKRKRIYAYADTEIGRISLARSPSGGRDPESMAGGYENWEIFLGEEVVAVIYDIAAPGYPLRSRIKSGVNTSLDGCKFEIKARDSLLSSGRRIVFSSPPRTVFVFRKSGFQVILEGGDRDVLARKAHGRWVIGCESKTLVFLICIFEFADLQHFLVNPVLRNI